MLQVIKVETKGNTINFCEMLRVNLHLLQLLQNLMTAPVNTAVTVNYIERMSSVKITNPGFSLILL